MVINKKVLLNKNNKKAQRLETLKFFYEVNPQRFADVLRIHGVSIKDEIDFQNFLTELEEDKINFDLLKFMDSIKLKGEEIAKAYNRLEII